MKASDLADEATLASRFADEPPAMAASEARFEASRCLFCFDPPCTRACPTAIDVPTFIRQILHRDDLGAARTILGANIFGGSCARACPTEVLCEGACVDRTLLRAPVQIGRLQRFACDAASDVGARFFGAGSPTGRRVAVIGSGPAGLSCAHELKRLGHEPVVFEARGTPGGLDSRGIARYKVSAEFALGEIASILAIGIDLRLDRPIDPAAVPGLLDEYDAVFLGVGLGRTAPLGILGEELPGVVEALDFIAQTHDRPLSECEVGRRVVVLGAGNTAIDAAIAARRLGAEVVTLAYRRGEATLPAFTHEYERARGDGVRFAWHARPTRIVGPEGRVVAVEFVRTETDPSADRSSRLRDAPGPPFSIPADLVIKALGQEPLFGLLDAVPGLVESRGRVVVDPETGATGVDRLFAGGDCTRVGGEVVDAVRDGKAAARAIDRSLTPRPRA